MPNNRRRVQTTIDARAQDALNNLIGIIKWESLRRHLEARTNNAILMTLNAKLVNEMNCQKMLQAFLALITVLAFVDAHAQSSLPPCPTNTSAVWTNCFGTYTWPDGGKYVGEWKDGTANGQGTFTFPDGEKYVGEWKDDTANGQGTNTWPDGRKYVGEWKDDKQNGQGTFTFPDGEKYVGEWKDDKREGEGIQYNPNGSVKESGMWRDDQLSQAFAIDTARFPFERAAKDTEKNETTQRKSDRPAGVTIVQGCLAKGLKPGTNAFSNCIAGD